MMAMAVTAASLDHTPRKAYAALQQKSGILMLRRGVTVWRPHRPRGQAADCSRLPETALIWDAAIRFQAFSNHTR